MDNVKINKKVKNLSKSEYENLTKEELIEKLISVEAHNNQLKNIIAKKNHSQKRSASPQKPYDFTKVRFRHVFLRCYYLGWDYQGFATQEDSFNTIEHYIFDALIKTCLIKNRETSNYHRCARTDKGVSSFSQIISIDVRSRLSEEEQNDVDSELNYCKMLNRVLPENIQFISWCTMPSGSSARFDCIQRTYRYIFPRADLNIDAMRKGLSYLVGSHDFRNFCKMDIANGVVQFVRNLIEAKIEKCTLDKSESAYDMLQIVLVGNAFLWHQVRCIVGILLLIGENKEQPEIVKELLDVDKNPSSQSGVELFSAALCKEAELLHPGSVPPLCFKIL